MRRLTKAFFERDPLEVAPDLIGCVLVHDDPAGRLAVRLVETEAYWGSHDPGSHGFRGPSPRNLVMFGPPGRLYVYFTYGMHFCSNVVCGREGECAAVLLRAGEPIEGLDLMRARRPMAASDRLLCSGPARLTQALGISRPQNGTSLLRGSTMWLYRDATTEEYQRGPIAQTPRIGISPGRGDELPWRFVVPGHPHASRRT